MQLPSRLSSTTLGDLLGKLHRAQLSGVLELRELAGPRAGITHRIHLRVGLVAFLESEGPKASSSDDLRLGLDRLFQLPDAAITFRVARPLAEPPPPLGPSDFLHGRPRARDSHRPTAPLASTHSRALAMLGLDARASRTEVQRAFRQMVLTLHPDRYPHAGESERKALSEQLIQVTQAYKLLVA